MTVFYNPELLTKKTYPINDRFMKDLRMKWEHKPWPVHRSKDFIPMAVEWFSSTKLNNLTGWEEFPCTDVIMGCTHYIESFILKYGWSGFQILPYEYSYYGLMGKHGTEPGNLTPNVPLIVSLPSYQHADIRPGWQDILVECEQKNIDIHIDFAWLTTAKDIEFDLAHPCIKSFAMSMSKYNLHWNRIGIRWCRQRTMDSVTIFNHYYDDVNSGITTCGAFMVKHIPRDYMWDNYRQHHHDLCQQLNLRPTNIIHVALDQKSNPIGIGRAIQAVV